MNAHPGQNGFNAHCWCPSGPKDLEPGNGGSQTRGFFGQQKWDEVALSNSGGQNDLPLGDLRAEWGSHLRDVCKRGQPEVNGGCHLARLHLARGKKIGDKE